MSFPQIDQSCNFSFFVREWKVGCSLCGKISCNKEECKKKNFAAFMSSAHATERAFCDNCISRIKNNDDALKMIKDDLAAKTSRGIAWLQDVLFPQQ